ncbi:MMPL family protein [Mycobacterium xenopi 3993]|nr:MMPL family protein [Mycobacterium xenopi 3993]
MTRARAIRHGPVGQADHRGGAQSVDGKAAYVLLRLAGDIGQMKANRSVAAVRDIVAKDTPPPASRSTSAARHPASDTVAIANSSLNNITIAVISSLAMLLLVYRSISNVLVPLLAVVIEMLVAKA